VLSFVYIGVGGFLGAVSRYAVTVWCAQRWGADFPYGTLAVNTLGSMAIGFVLTWIGGRLAVPSEVRLLLVVGFLGGFTTFSSFAYETFRLAEQGAIVGALLNLLLNVSLSMASVTVGVLIARVLQSGGN